MDGLRWVLWRRRTARVAPSPEGTSCQKPQEKSSAPIPAGTEASAGWLRGWTRLAFLSRRSPAPAAGAERSERLLKWRWRCPTSQLGKWDTEQEGSWTRHLWGCFCWKASRQETSPTDEQEAAPGLLPPDLSTSPEQKAGDPCTVTGRSSSPEAPCSWDYESSPTETLSNQLEGEDLSPEEQLSAEEGLSPDDEAGNDEDLALEDYDDDDEEDDYDEDIAMEEATGRTIMDYLQAGDMTMGKQIRFLHAIPLMRYYAEKMGRDTLEPPSSKIALMERIADMLEALPLDSGPSTILSCSLVAMAKLSKLRPALDRELESRLLRATMSQIFAMDTVKYPYAQAHLKTLEQKLDEMLRTLLTASPNIDTLQHMLEHIVIWIQSRNPRERARAARTGATLLRYAALHPQFDNTLEFSQLGHLVAQLGLTITDPVEDVGRLAKDGIYRLYELLLRHRGMDIFEAEVLWTRDQHQDRRLLAFVNTARVGQVFGKIFSEEQRRLCLQTALQATHHPIVHISEAGVLLAYALQGAADKLLGEKLEDVLTKIRQQLYTLQSLKQVPEELNFLDDVGSPKGTSPSPRTHTPVCRSIVSAVYNRGAADSAHQPPKPPQSPERPGHEEQC